MPYKNCVSAKSSYDSGSVRIYWVVIDLYVRGALLSLCDRRKAQSRLDERS